MRSFQMDMRVPMTGPTIASAGRKNLDALLNPRNVALVGASDRPGHWSKRVWDNLRRFGFRGQVFPVNPKRAEVWGSTCFASLDDLPEAPDHLAIFTPADTTLDVIQAGVSAGARSATIYAAGFGEGGDAEGSRLAGRLNDLLAESGLVAVGPNCMGIASGRARFSTIPDETLQEFAPSPIAVITQSGALCAPINRALNQLGHKVGILVSCGNQLYCKISDVIDYCADQPELRVVLCYIEAIHDPDLFFKSVRRARDNGKSVVAVKIGGSEEARASALAHTGSLAGSSEVFDVFAAAAGVIRLDSIEDAIEAVEFLARSPLPRGRDIAVMTNSGALRSLITEAADRTGAQLARLSDETTRALDSTMGPGGVSNPLDTRRTLPTDQYAACLDILATAPEVDIVLVAEELPRDAGIERRVANLRALQHAAAGAQAIGKSVAMFTPMLLGLSDYGREIRMGMPQVPVLRGIETTLRVMHALGEAGTRPRHSGEFFPPQADSEIARLWRTRAAALDGPTALSEVESKRLLLAYGIPLPLERCVQNEAEVEQAVGEIGFPVVLKAVCSAVPHKSDAGLVMLDIRDVASLRRGVATLTARCGALGVAIEGILVAKQVSGGIETVLGIHRDPELGPVVMFGMGGVWIELFKDVTFAPTYLDRDAAADMVRTTRAGRLLDGFRGAKPGDCATLYEALVNLGRLARDLGDVIESIDINPFTVCERGQGAFALDGLVVLRPAVIARGDLSSNKQP